MLGSPLPTGSHELVLTSHSLQCSEDDLQRELLLPGSAGTHQCRIKTRDGLANPAEIMVNELTRWISRVRSATRRLGSDGRG